MKAYLINLDRSDDRLLHMRAEFGRAAIAFDRIAAVDGAGLALPDLAGFRLARSALQPEGWLPGEVGCFLSHFAVWKEIAVGGEDWAAVFEDDIRLAADTRLLLQSADWIPPGADIVRLEANRPMRLGGGRGIEAVPGRKIYRALSGSAGSAGYLVSRRGAARLVESPPELHMSVDVFLFKPKLSRIARELKRYQVVPAVCVQEGVRERGGGMLASLIKIRSTRGRGYRERLHPILQLWPISRHAVPFRP